MWAPVAALVAVVGLAGCGGASPRAAAPSTPSTASPYKYTPGQVLGWVSTTLENGASLVTTLAAGASDAQVLAASQQLGVACSNAKSELEQTGWSGPAHADEAALVSTVERVASVIAAPPADVVAALRPQLATIDEELARLGRDVRA